MKKIYVCTAVVLFLMANLSLAQSNSKKFIVKYISAQNIYVDGGRVEGVQVGDTLIVYRSDQQIARLGAAYVSDHSAACQILSSIKKPRQGDVVVNTARHIFAEEKKTSRTRTVPERQKLKRRRRVGTQISGSLSLQWYHIEDLSTSGFNFDQPGLRLNLRLRNIADKNYNFRVKTRTRYYQRSRRLSGSIPKEEWRNRIYTVSFGFDDESAMFNYQFGRILSNTIAGIGYIDGLMLQQNVSTVFRYGLFAGTQPQWQYSRYQTSLQKYGAFVNFHRGDYQRQRFESTLAFAGEYHNNIVSREFIYFQNNYYASRFSFYQSAEVDVNRDWRKQRAGEDLSITNLYVNTNLRLLNNLSLGLSYDNRKNYYTYEIRSVADSLFDDAMRYGFRGNLNWRLPSRTTLFANFGLRRRENDQQNTLSYSAGVSQSNLSSLRLFLRFFGSGFSNYYSDGYHFSFNIGKHFRQGHDLDISYGAYNYQIKSVNNNRSNQWVRVNASIQILRHMYVMEHYEYVWGSDAPGHRIFTELGYRF